MRSIHGFDPSQPRDSHGRWEDTEIARIEGGVTVTTAAGRRKTDDILRVGTRDSRPGDEVMVVNAGYGRMSMTGKIGRHAGDVGNNEAIVEFPDGSHPWIPKRNLEVIRIADQLQEEDNAEFDRLQEVRRQRKAAQHRS